MIEHDESSYDVQQSWHEGRDTAKRLDPVAHSLGSPRASRKSDSPPVIRLRQGHQGDKYCDIEIELGNLSNSTPVPYMADPV